MGLMRLLQNGDAGDISRGFWVLGGHMHMQMGWVELDQGSTGNSSDWYARDWPFCTAGLVAAITGLPGTASDAVNTLLLCQYNVYQLLLVGSLGLNRAMSKELNDMYQSYISCCSCYIA